jgi:hypothetical protein
MLVRIPCPVRTNPGAERSAGRPVAPVQPLRDFHMITDQSQSEQEEPRAVKGWGAAGPFGLLKEDQKAPRLALEGTRWT